jgi:hypothetical protein
MASTHNVNAKKARRFRPVLRIALYSPLERYVLESGAHRIKRYDVSPIVDGENAIDLIGQYTDETLETLVPVYTKSGAHNAPNKLGLKSCFVCKS